MESLAAGSRCLTSVEGSWTPATIRAVFADGTAKVECDQRSTSVLPCWYGVTLAELLFEDRARWPECREALSLPEHLGVEELVRLVAACGSRATPEEIASFRAREAALDGYDLVLRAGFAATEGLARSRGEPPRSSGRIYWNQIRMGGRERAELVRAITIEDALRAIGIVDATRDLDPSHRELPAELRRYYAGLGDARGLAEIQPNNPELIRPALEPMRGLRSHGLEGDLGIVVMQHHDFEWVAAFDPGEADARIYVNWGEGDEREWRFVSPTVGLFFWDVAQTALAWWNDSGFRGGKPVVRTDVGEALAP